MTYRDNDRIRNPDDPWHREWGIGSIIASLVAIVIMAGIPLTEQLSPPTCQHVAARYRSLSLPDKFE